MATYSISDLDNRLTPSPLMPVLFVGHGNPMHAIADNSYTQKWAEVGRGLPEAQAIVVVSAHWLTPGQTHITDAPRNKIIYDFGGFPDELYRVQYDTVGDQGVASGRRSSSSSTRPNSTSSGVSTTAHGACSSTSRPPRRCRSCRSASTTRCRCPSSSSSTADCVRCGGAASCSSAAATSSMPSTGSSGTAAAPGTGPKQFDADTAVARSATARSASWVNPYATWSEARIAVPTDDHYRPMVAALSLLEDGEEIEFFNDEIDMGAVSMRSFISV